MIQIYNSREELTEQQVSAVVKGYAASVLSNKRDRHVKMQELFPNNLSSDSKILDYGCVTGVVSQLFSEKYNCMIDGVEISQHELRKAKITYRENRTSIL